MRGMVKAMSNSHTERKHQELLAAWGPVQRIIGIIGRHGYKNYITFPRVGVARVHGAIEIDEMHGSGDEFVCICSGGHAEIGEASGITGQVRFPTVQDGEVRRR